MDNPTFSLAEITTKDQLLHQGIYFSPTNKNKKALLWVHGLTSNFYSHIKLLEEFARQCESMGWGFASFNNRGHDIITGIKKIDPAKESGYSRVNGGAGYEDFAECIFDIEAGIDFLVGKGFSEIILIGHSTGANKSSYFAGTQKNPHHVATVLASPVSDRYDLSLDQAQIAKDLVKMQKLIDGGKGDNLVLDVHLFPATPKRFVSSFLPHGVEDQFDYSDAQPQLADFKNIKKPLLILLGDLDEYLDKSAQTILDVYQKYQTSTAYKSVLLTGVPHSYKGFEKRVVTEIVEWSKDL